MKLSRLQRAFVAGLCVALAQALAVLPAAAHDWNLPTVKSFSSANGTYVLEVSPRLLEQRSGIYLDLIRGKKLPGKTGVPDNYAKARLERVGSDGSRTLVWSARLENDLSPVSALVTDDGRFTVTFDDWNIPGLGENVVVIYGDRGQLIRKFALEEILTADQVQQLPESQWRVWGDKHSVAGHVLTLRVQQVEWSDALPGLGQTIREMSIALEDGRVLAAIPAGHSREEQEARFRAPAFEHYRSWEPEELWRVVWPMAAAVGSQASEAKRSRRPPGGPALPGMTPEDEQRESKTATRSLEAQEIVATRELEGVLLAIIERGSAEDLAFLVQAQPLLPVGTLPSAWWRRATEGLSEAESLSEAFWATSGESRSDLRGTMPGPARTGGAAHAFLVETVCANGWPEGALGLAMAADPEESAPWLCDLLAKVPDLRLLPAVVSWLDGPSRGARDSAERLLSNWRDPAVLAAVEARWASKKLSADGSEAALRVLEAHRNSAARLWEHVETGRRRCTSQELAK